MGNIKDLEDRIKDAEAALDALKADLEHLKQQEQPEPESLFGRWATYPDYGRGIIIDAHEDYDSEVQLVCPDEDFFTGSYSQYVPISDLIIDPAVLRTLEDYDQAPIGTIIEVSTGGVAYKNGQSGWYRSGNNRLWSNDGLAVLGAARVVRWGTGA